MKTIKPFCKVAGILFLMYFHLMLVTAIGYKVSHAQPTGIPDSQENAVSKAPADETPQPIVIDTPDRPTKFIEPVPDPEPEPCIEGWMLYPNYLDDDIEPVAPIEAWMLDKDYLKISG
jgi:hypothetical protein